MNVRRFHYFSRFCSISAAALVGALLWSEIASAGHAFSRPARAGEICTTLAEAVDEKLGTAAAATSAKAIRALLTTASNVDLEEPDSLWCWNEYPKDTFDGSTAMFLFYKRIAKQIARLESSSDSDKVKSKLHRFEIGLVTFLEHFPASQHQDELPAALSQVFAKLAMFDSTILTPDRSTAKFTCGDVFKALAPLPKGPNYGPVETPAETRREKLEESRYDLWLRFTNEEVRDLSQLSSAPIKSETAELTAMAARLACALKAIAHKASANSQ